MPPEISWRRIEWVVLLASPLAFALLIHALMRLMEPAPAAYRLAALAMPGTACNFALWSFVSRSIRARLAAIKSHNRLLATDVAKMHKGVFIFKEDGTILCANASVSAFTGLTPDQVKGPSLFRLMEASGVSDGWQICRGAPPEGWRGELHMRDGQGQSRVVRGWAAPVSGGVWLAVMRDITGDRRLEAESWRIAELTGILKAVRTINHEINNPLFVILASIEMIETRFAEADERTRARFKNIQEAVRRIEEVAQNLSQLVRTATANHSLPSPRSMPAKRPSMDRAIFEAVQA
ncbi:MAG: PAS domain-containing protein [Armatimonadetes bacterium]|nr:PAS domain-containing protein [Armatimonadota bacterium]